MLLKVGNKSANNLEYIECECTRICMEMGVCMAAMFKMHLACCTIVILHTYVGRYNVGILEG